MSPTAFRARRSSGSYLTDQTFDSSGWLRPQPAAHQKSKLVVFQQNRRYG